MHLPPDGTRDEAGDPEEDNECWEHLDRTRVIERRTTEKIYMSNLQKTQTKRIISLTLSQRKISPSYTTSIHRAIGAPVCEHNTTPIILLCNTITTIPEFVEFKALELHDSPINISLKKKHEVNSQVVRCGLSSNRGLLW
jgi:hypothetical protein